MSKPLQVLANLFEPVNYDDTTRLLDFLSKRSLSHLLYHIKEQNVDSEWQLLRDFVEQIEAAERGTMQTRLEDDHPIQCEADKNQITLVFGGKSRVRRTISPEKARVLALVLLQSVQTATEAKE